MRSDPALLHVLSPLLFAPSSDDIALMVFVSHLHALNDQFGWVVF
jgi:hypothetical protein